MAKSPLRRNRRFERIAIPILLVLFVVVMGRQLRAMVAHSHTNERCEIRIERVHDAHRHDADRRAARHHARHERLLQGDVMQEMDARVARDVEHRLVRDVVHVER